MKQQNQSIHKNRTLWLFLTLLPLSLAFTAAPAAAEDRTKISKVRLEFTSDITPGYDEENVEVEVVDGEEGYYVNSCDVTNVPESKWNELDPPVVEIELYADEDYYFGSTSSSGFDLDLTDNSVFKKVEFVKATQKYDKTVLVLTVKMRFRLSDGKSETVYNPKQLKWDETAVGIGSWQKAIGAAYYQVQLEKDGESVGRITKVNDLTYDFGSQITEPGTYRFQVRTVSEYKVQGKWVKSKKLKITQAQLPLTEAGWKKAADDVRWWWSNGDGTWPASQWREINGYWYYFNEEGYMAVGWITVEEKEYYLDPGSGALYQDTTTPDGIRVGADGARIS